MDEAGQTSSTAGMAVAIVGANMIAKIGQLEVGAVVDRLTQGGRRRWRQPVNQGWCTAADVREL